MLHNIAAVFLKPGGPYVYVRLVTAAYAVSAIGRLIPVRRKQVPGYRRRRAAAGPPGSARRRARPRGQDRSVPPGWPPAPVTVRPKQILPGSRAGSMSALGPGGGEMHRSAGQIVAQVAVIGVAVIAMAAPAAAAAQTHHSGAVPTGNDLSYPQCGTAFPASPAFGIVGVNGGLANDLNPCLGPSSSYPSYQQAELYWAVAVPTGATSQPKASLYVNTADPGNVYNGTPIADWPTTGSTPYGTCATTTVTTGSGTYTVGQNSAACAWQYGYNKAAQDVSWVSAEASAIDAQAPPVSVPAAASGYPWWLDVETQNTWQGGTSGQAMNVADLQGMIAALQQAGATAVGTYSTSAQWRTVTGGTSSASGSLYQIPDWIPGAKTLSGAKTNCGLASFTSGRVAITQWSGRPDHDYAC